MTAREDFATSLFALYIRGRLGFSNPPFTYSVQGARPVVEHHTAHTHTSEDDERVHGRHHTCATNGWNLTFSVQNDLLRLLVLWTTLLFPVRAGRGVRRPGGYTVVTMMPSCCSKARRSSMRSWSCFLFYSYSIL